MLLVVLLGFTGAGLLIAGILALFLPPSAALLITGLLFLAGAVVAAYHSPEWKQKRSD